MGQWVSPDRNPEPGSVVTRMFLACIVMRDMHMLLPAYHKYFKLTDRFLGDFMMIYYHTMMHLFTLFPFLYSYLCLLNLKCICVLKWLLFVLQSTDQCTCRAYYNKYYCNPSRTLFSFSSYFEIQLTDQHFLLVSYLFKQVL